ncbi:MAG: hypothetical protein IJT83_03910, partial [Victivallales bacterium]|nr:hypothetical protein [Victivallales bacterium]
MYPPHWKRAIATRVARWTAPDEPPQGTNTGYTTYPTLRPLTECHIGPYSSIVAPFRNADNSTAHVGLSFVSPNWGDYAYCSPSRLQSSVAAAVVLRGYAPRSQDAGQLWYRPECAAHSRTYPQPPPEDRGGQRTGDKPTAPLPGLVR